MPLPDPSALDQDLDRIRTPKYAEIVQRHLRENSAREDRALARLQADIDSTPLKQSAAYDDPTPPVYLGQARHREDDHAPPSSRDGDAVRFGLGLVVLFGLARLLMWLVGY